VITISEARKLALALPEVEEKSHFNQPDFRVKGKIFAVLHAKRNEVMVKLSLIDQSVFCAIDKNVIYPVPGGWGRKGATLINLKKVKRSIFLDALITAWKTTAPVKLVAKYYPGPT
jgi:hypothetical protein